MNNWIRNQIFNLKTKQLNKSEVHAILKRLSRKSLKFRSQGYHTQSVKIIILSANYF